jgi:predicted transcriptional regulator YheO
MHKRNETILENYKRLAKTISQTFGRNCEVAIHDFGLLPNSLLHIEGVVTNRKLGAPITDLVVRALKRYGDDVEDINNYSATTADGRHLKSSTSFIRGHDGKVIGAFCVNFDISSFMNAKAAIEEFMKTSDSQRDQETFASSLGETVDSLIAKRKSILWASLKSKGDSCSRARSNRLRGSWASPSLRSIIISRVFDPKKEKTSNKGGKAIGN